MPRADAVLFDLIIDDRDVVPFAVTAGALRDWARKRNLHPPDDLEDLYRLAEEDLVCTADRLYAAGFRPNGAAPVVIGSGELNGPANSNRKDNSSRSLQPSN